MKRYNVVAAVIEHDGEILCVQRGMTRFDYTSFKWEFPGGKIEDGETPQQALKREIAEELEYEISVGDEVMTVVHEYPDFIITMTAFRCTANDRRLRLTEHIAQQWLPREELMTLDWAAADVPIVERVWKG